MKRIVMNATGLYS